MNIQYATEIYSRKWQTSAASRQFLHRMWTSISLSIASLWRIADNKNLIKRLLNRAKIMRKQQKRKTITQTKISRRYAFRLSASSIDRMTSFMFDIFAITLVRHSCCFDFFLLSSLLLRRQFDRNDKPRLHQYY